MSKGAVYVLLALGFAGLIGAHEVAGTDADADMTVPLILASAGTLAFVAAGVLAWRMMKRGTIK